MYPNLYYAFRDLFGVEWSGLRFVNSFGFFVALSFLAAAYILSRELKRKQREGILQFKEVKIVVGKPASAAELLLNFVLGFILGYKIVGLFFSDTTATNPQQYIFSSEGNFPAGLALGILFAGVKWWEKNKRKLPKPEERPIRIWPHDRVGDLVIYAALFGFLGAKIFHNLEDWDNFKKDPVGSLLSFSGLTFYGGLICATAAIWWYAKKQKIRFRYLCDAAAPGLMIAYAIGRIGCQVSGDGDWGILNSAYLTNPESKVQKVEPAHFQQTLEYYKSFYLKEFKIDTLSEVPHHSVTAPSWLPDWTIAYSYPHNVIEQGVAINGCTGDYCNHLPIPVFPTPFYETIMGLILFAFLWAIRKRIKTPGVLFAIYLIVNGIERFFIEKIKVNYHYDFGFIHPTQAELISSALILGGIGLWIYFQKRPIGSNLEIA